MVNNSNNVDIPRDSNAPPPMAGTTVYDSKGAKLGTVKTYDERQAYFVMEQGLLIHKDVYVPLDAIAGAHSDGIRLYLSKDDLHNVKWDQPPTGALASAAPMTDDARDTAMPVTDDDILREQMGGQDVSPDQSTEPPLP
jgi:hypothetical protein